MSLSIWKSSQIPLSQWHKSIFLGLLLVGSSTWRSSSLFWSFRSLRNALESLGKITWAWMMFGHAPCPFLTVILMSLSGLGCNKEVLWNFWAKIGKLASGGTIPGVRCKFQGCPNAWHQSKGVNCLLAVYQKVSPVRWSAIIWPVKLFSSVHIYPQTVKITKRGLQIWSPAVLSLYDCWMMFSYI